MGLDHRQPAGPHPGLLGCPVRSSRIARVRPRPQGADTRSPPARISFIASRRGAVRAMTQTLASANAAAAILAAARTNDWPPAACLPACLPACCLSGRPVTGNRALNAAGSSRPPWPPGGYPPGPARPPPPSTQMSRSPTPTGTPRPTACPGGRRRRRHLQTARPGLRKRLARRKTAPGPMDPAPARRAISGRLSSTPSERNTQAITYWHTKVDTTQRMSNT